MDGLQNARETTNRVDREMARLFTERMEAAKEVARYKRAHALQITDASREEEVIERNSALIEDETSEPIMLASCAIISSFLKPSNTVCLMVCG